jgi:hypothetical protein
MMNRILINFIYFSLIAIVFSNPSFAGGSFSRQKPSEKVGKGDAVVSSPIEKVLSNEVIANTLFPMLSLDSQKALFGAGYQCHMISQIPFANSWVSRIEEIVDKYGGFIPLPGDDSLSNGDEIAAFGIPQELWVEVMGNNPSFFKEEKHCPGPQGPHKKMIIHGVLISMCPEFPVETIRGTNYGKKDSDEEFIAKLNKIYEKAGRKNRFRCSRVDEYYYADTVGGASLKRESDALLDKNDPRYLGNYTPYMGDEKDQPRSILENVPNALNFRRSGVQEWIMNNNFKSNPRNLVGSSYGHTSDIADSKNPPLSIWSGMEPVKYVGPCRLVRVKSENQLPKF